MSSKKEVEIQRLRLVIRGAVQGVGFRPFIYRLASEMELAGWVSNSAQGVFIEVEGEKNRLESFLTCVERKKPPRAFIQSLEPLFLDPVGYSSFEIRASDRVGEKTVLILPDIATCLDCMREVLDSADRRYLYPFTNCTNCGPRFTIIESLPYDRPNTTMKNFEMCEQCRREYEDPLDRRFHAQPIACPDCGPQLELWDEHGKALATRHEALLEAAEAIRAGKIVAMKGLGGFHLIVDARDDEAVERLRFRKRREEKPFALMYPSLEAVKLDCAVSELEERLLLSPESPIVLLQRRDLHSGLVDESRRSTIENSRIQAPHLPSHTSHPASDVSCAVAPNNPYLGVMLPYTPLHHLLMRELGFPVVATSGNLSDEPICTDEHDALKRLNGIADLFLVHNRPIARHVDDSILRIVGGRELILRRARGYAPLPIRLKESLPSFLAVGAHLKNTIALSVGRDVFISQHIGDLDTSQAYQAFAKVLQDFERLYDARPEAVGHDLHPDYLSTRYAQKLGQSLAAVQHHYAHVLACMAENEVDPPVLGISWDGTGYGTDGTVWGGEFLLVFNDSFERVAHLRTFRLPGGEKAIKEPRRSAFGVLYEMFGEDLLKVPTLPQLHGLHPLRGSTKEEIMVWLRMLKTGVNSPLSSSVGRLFDAVASLVGLRQTLKFEGQAAMELEFAIAGRETEEAYPFSIADCQLPVEKRGMNGEQQRGQTAESAIHISKSEMVVDWQPMLRAMLDDIQSAVPISKVSAKFHNALVESIVAVARRVGQQRVVLSGGCFQNRYLSERAIKRLKEEGFCPYWHQRVPPNDGGIALGQIVAAARRRWRTQMEMASEQSALEGQPLAPTTS